MKIVIIEDEAKTARALAALITAVQPGAEILALLPSVRSAVNWFRGGTEADLVFMDVQLADGVCFDIFREVEVSAPVVFCTAYEEYAIEGFKVNGIDYILKPFSEAALKAALAKMERLKNYFRQEGEYRHLLEPLTTTQGKNSFLVYKESKYSIVATENIAFFYVRGELPVLHTFDNKEYFVNQSLDMLESVLPPGNWYRITRKCLVQFSAVKEIEHYFSRRLLVHLRVSTPDQLIVSKEKSGAFLHWLDHR
ncbi:MAG: response regulator transcription factor [Bacteroidetes bacterium]|nr:response regulator transcription factor [Bacteroidota bacterium]